jgi:hypothetical protein
LAKKIFPNGKTLLLGKKSSTTAQNARTDGKVRLLAKGFFPNSIPVGNQNLLAKPRRGQTVPVPSASPTASPLAVGKGNNPFANRATMLLVMIALCQHHVHVVGKQFSFFSNFEFKLFW